MNDPQLKERLEEIADKLFSPANRFAKNDAVKRVLDFLKYVNPGLYYDLWRSLYIIEPKENELDKMMPMEHRLELLAIRLYDEGRYTDSEICFATFEKLKKSA